MTKNFLSGNTNSPIPIPKGYPKDVIKGAGPYVIDHDGKKFIDMWMGYGALLFGHAYPKIARTIKNRIQNGWFFSYQTKVEKEMASVLHSIIPSAERVRFSTTGSDAVAYAIRASKAYTSRKKVLSIKGGYHGVHENMISSAGVSQITNTPDFVSFNDIGQAKKALQTRRYACMILEPVLANSGCTPSNRDYLVELRKICTKTGTVLIFDEIVTGFRLSLGGAQVKYNVTPDMSLFSKAIASGLPLSVVCGKKSIMENFIPTGNVFFAGTFNAHPLSLTVAKEVVNLLKKGEFYLTANSLGERLRSFLALEIEKNRLNACVQGVGSMLTIAFGCKSFVHGIANEKVDKEKYEIFIAKMASKGILLPPLPTETIFLSPVHKNVIGKIENSFKEALFEISKLH